MLTRYSYTKIILNIVLIILLTGISFWFLYNEYSYALIVLSAIGIIICSFRILLTFNKIQQNISYFFNAVENNDSTLHFSETIANKPLRELHKSLNHINKLIKDAKLKNKEQELYFGALLEQLNTGIVVMNDNGNILQSNSTAKKLLNCTTLTHIIQLKRVDDKLYNAFTKLEKGRRQLVKLNHNNITTQLTLRATNFQTQAVNYTLVSIQDIYNELDAKEVEAWTKLIRVLTHEIMNSITPITSLSDTLLTYYSNNDEPVNEKTKENTIKGLEVIKERGTGLMHFVNSYRKLTKISQPILQQIEVKPFIDHLLLLVKDEKTIFLRDISSKKLIINADEGQISQVLLNLLKNAAYAVKNTKNPIIKISANSIGENSVKQVQIIISDNGTGISPELLEQIFTPFFTTKENGSGIGLSLSRQIMRNHGGNIKVLSEVGKGSKFILEFNE